MFLMDKTTILIIFWAVVVSIFGVFLLINYLRNKKWMMTMQLDKQTFVYGEQVTGNFEVLAKQEILGNGIFCELTWYVTIYFYNQKINWTDQKDVLFYTDKIQIEPATTYPIGYKKSSPFAIKTPPALPPNVTKPINTMGIPYTVSPQIRRCVKITLDAAGIDLSTSKIIYIN